MAKIQMGLKKKTSEYLFILPALIVVLVFLFPFSYLIYMSLVNMGPLVTNLRFVGLNNYKWIFLEDHGFLNSLSLMTRWISINLSIQFTLGFLTAVAVKDLIKTRSLRSIVTSLILIPSMTAPVAVGSYFRVIFNSEFGPLNYYLSKIGITPPNWLGDPSIALYSVMLTSIWSGAPLVFLLSLAGLLGLPQELYEAAKVDGASSLQMFFYITIPLMRSLLLTILLLRFVDIARIFDKLFVLTGGGPGRSTEILTMHIYMTSFRYLRFSKGAALSVFLAALVLSIAGIIVWINKKEK